MQRLQGNLLGLKPSQKEKLEKLYQRRCDPLLLVTPELARTLTELSQDTRRQIGILIDRRGKIQDVLVGDAKQIEISGIGRYRAGQLRLRGIRFIHTHLKGEKLSPDDLTDLALLRFDAIAAIEVTDQGLPGKVFWAHLLPESGKTPSSPSASNEQSDTAPLGFWQLEEASSPHQLPRDFIAFIESLEREWSSAQSSATQAGPKKRRAVLVGVTHISHSRQSPDGATQLSRATLQRHMIELQNLAESADLEVVEVIQQKRSNIDPRFVVGSGKMKELYMRCMQLQADLLIFEGELSASQVRAISDFGELEVWDRTQLILGIFAKRAHSRGGKLQVELAMLKYTLPRLVMKDDFLSRLTGGIGARGPGETKMEILQRRIRDRITRLERELGQLSKERKLRRQKRTSSSQLTVSLVGYTNAGKSTFLNALTKAGVLAEHRMFATLDPTSRRLFLPSGRTIVLTDTVGFIRDLPADLARAFRATLEELGDADFLIHLVDGSNPEFLQQIDSVSEILCELAFDHIPIQVMINKADVDVAPGVAELAKEQNWPMVSSLSTTTLRPALEQLEKRLSQRDQEEQEKSTHDEEALQFQN